MAVPARPHLLGIDDGPFDKRNAHEIPVVGVMMEGADLIEAVAVTRFPLDGGGVTTFLAEWVTTCRFRPALQGVVLGGITIAGLAVVDVEQLASLLSLPVLVVNRREPTDEPLLGALESAGLTERQPLVKRAPAPRAVGAGLFVGAAGIDADGAEALVRATRGKSELPEPLRVAHLVAAALARGESRGRP